MNRENTIAAHSTVSMMNTRGTGRKIILMFGDSKKNRGSDQTLGESEICKMEYPDADGAGSLEQNGSSVGDLSGEYSGQFWQVPLFMKHAPVAIAMFDTQMRYIAASRRWLSDYNLGDGCIIGKSHYEVFPNIPKRWKEIFQRSLNSSAEVNEEEAFPRLDGGVDWIKWVITPWRNQEGSVGGLIMYTEIVTERKQETERLRASLMQLRHKTRELETLNRELDAFSSSVSHDLRAPLKLIEGYAGLLRSNYSSEFDENGQKCLGNITRAVNRMSGLIRDLLKLSQLTNSKLEFQPVDINEIVRGIIEDIRRDDNHRHSVDITIEEDLATVADRRLIRIALDNLLRNAWKFTEDQTDAKIRVGKTKDCKGRQVFFIQDNGIGFDVSRTDDLFLPFSRVHDERFGGEGVGLATVRRIISRHGGSIWAEGKLGEGATFSFTLD